MGSISIHYNFLFCFTHFSPTPSFFTKRMTIISKNRACLLFFVYICLIGAESTTKWKTLNGKPPIVIARGGFSGLFPDSSSKSYEWATLFSLRDVVLWCEVQLTRDGVGICAPDMNLEDFTDIDLNYKSQNESYIINGEHVHGWFTTDFTYPQLSNVSLRQGVRTRPPMSDEVSYPLLKVDTVANQTSPHGLWLNVQNDQFFTREKLNMSHYLSLLLTRRQISYISSPDLAFLRGIKVFTPKRTKLIFRFSTNDNISLSEKFPILKEVVTGVVLPKELIYPVGVDGYLTTPSSLVSDAHKIGLEVYAYSFSNDIPYAYDFGYDPMAEYQHFIDNGHFSVDGVISDFPVTPSAAIACYSGLPKAPFQEKPTVISSCGSSGLYAACTNDSYTRAISDGVDILDCPVQMTRDGVPICLRSINLSNNTSVEKSRYRNMKRFVPELDPAAGVFAFSLTWSQIQTLTPSLSSVCSYGICLPRNPKNARAGKFLSLAEFLNLANNSSSISGVLISIDHSSYLLEQENLHLVDSVLTVLRTHTQSLNKRRVLIQSSEIPILSKFKHEGKYEIILSVPYDIPDSTYIPMSIIKNLVSSVLVTKKSVYLEDDKGYLTDQTDVVYKLHLANLTVFVQLFRNEYVTQSFDVMSDPYMELNTFVSLSIVDGVVTEYPATAARYKRNRCLALMAKTPGRTPGYMTPILPGGLRQILSPPHNPGEEVSSCSKTKSGGVKDILFYIATVLVIVIATFLIGRQLLHWYHQHFPPQGAGAGQGIQLAGQ